MRPNKYPNSDMREAKRMFEMFSSAAPYIGEWAVKLSGTMEAHPRNVRKVFRTDRSAHQNSEISLADDNMFVYESSPKNSL